MDIGLFADDKILMYSAETLDDRSTGSGIFCLQKWITYNYLYLKVYKSEIIWFCEPHRDIRFQTDMLKNSDRVNYFGNYLDRSLSFDVRVDKVVNACARIRKFVNRTFPMLYYRSFIESIVRFGLLICACNTSSKLRSIYNVLRRLLKLIYFGKQREIMSCLFSESTILIVYNLSILGLLKFVLKSAKAKLPTR